MKYRLWYTPPPHQQREAIHLCDQDYLEVAKFAAIETIANWLAKGASESHQLNTHTFEQWLALFRSIVHASWEEKGKGIWIGTGYDGGSIVAPLMPIFKIELIEDTDNG